MNSIAISGIFAAAWGVWAGALAAGPIPPEALDHLPVADVVVLGEVHDNPLHHVNQARALAALRPRALVFEMLTPDQVARLPADRSDPVALEAALGWRAAGWPDFAMYHPLFIVAPAAQIFGGAMARADVVRAMQDGAAAVFGPDAAGYGLTAVLAAPLRAVLEAEQAQAHCGALHADLLPGMVEAQRLRDAALARAVVAALAETGGPVAVITGTGHARKDRGVPAVLAGAAPTLRVLSIGQAEADPGGDAPFDLWLITAPVDRGDPCAVFANQAGPKQGS
ncbi:MAG: ChaN family lipoprotein [Pseudorhodobacter sp.]|nr:ChaN family lipoprotein [Pseudorhodobacter sp.]